MRLLFRVVTSLFILLIICLLAPGIYADRLPNQTPESQLFTIDTNIMAVGIITDSSELDMDITSNETHTGILRKREVFSHLIYSDSLRTSGGKMSENRGLTWDSSSKYRNSDNLKTEKVVTYASTDGGHLLSDESYTLDIIGNYSRGVSLIKCVFGEPNHALYPSFANVVKAKSSLINFNSGKVSTKGLVRAISASNLTPADLKYRIAVTPDNSQDTTAKGTVRTDFSGDIMEARISNSSISNWNKASATNTWKDRTQASGDIENYQKVLKYQSGMII